MGFEPARVVWVYSTTNDGFGSGYLLTPDAVLTAAHILGGALEQIEVQRWAPQGAASWMAVQNVQVSGISLFLLSRTGWK